MLLSNLALANKMVRAVMIYMVFLSSKDICEAIINETSLISLFFFLFFPHYAWKNFFITAANHRPTFPHEFYPNADL